MKRHTWTSLGAIDRCQRCGLFRQKTGRGSFTHHVYRARIGDKWSTENLACLDPRQGSLDFLAEGDTHGRPALPRFEARVRANDNGIGRPAPESIASATGPELHASLMNVLTLQFDPLGRWGGETRLWRVVARGYGVRVDTERDIEETYPYAEQYAKSLMKMFPWATVEIHDLTNNVCPFRAWRNGKPLSIHRLTDIK